MGGGWRGGKGERKVELEGEGEGFMEGEYFPPNYF